MREVLDVIAGESAPVSQSSTGLIVGESEHAAGPIPIPHGGAAQEVGYPCPGNCLDYSHENARVPYSFAFEIYGPPTVRMATKSADASAPSIFLEQSSAASTSTEEGQGQLEEGHVDADGELYDVSLGSCFLETASSSSSGESKAAAISVHTGGRRSQSHGGHGHGRGGLSTLMTAEQCLSFFNPTDEQQFHNTLDEWSFRSVRLIEEVLKRVEAKAAQVAGQ